MVVQRAGSETAEFITAIHVSVHAYIGRPTCALDICRFKTIALRGAYYKAILSYIHHFEFTAHLNAITNPFKLSAYFLNVLKLL